MTSLLADVLELDDDDLEAADRIAEARPDLHRAVASAVGGGREIVDDEEEARKQARRSAKPGEHGELDLTQVVRARDRLRKASKQREEHEERVRRALARRLGCDLCGRVPELGPDDLGPPRSQGDPQA